MRQNVAGDEEGAIKSDGITESDGSAEWDPRANQKERTRTAILDAGLEILEAGTIPTVIAAATRAKVSRATAYRYFPSQQVLGEALAVRLPVLAAIDKAVSRLTGDDVEERVGILLDEYNSRVVENEPFMRTTLQYLQESWLRNWQELGDQAPSVRSQIRLRWVDEALRPCPDLTDEHRQRLRAALTLTLGIESVTVLKDVCQLDNVEALAVLRWTAMTLLRAEFDRAQPGSGSGSGSPTARNRDRNQDRS